MVRDKDRSEERGEKKRKSNEKSRRENGSNIHSQETRYHSSTLQYEARGFATQHSLSMDNKRRFSAPTPALVKTKT